MKILCKNFWFISFFISFKHHILFLTFNFSQIFNSVTIVILKFYFQSICKSFWIPTKQIKYSFIVKFNEGTTQFDLQCICCFLSLLNLIKQITYSSWNQPFVFWCSINCESFACSGWSICDYRRTKTIKHFAHHISHPRKLVKFILSYVLIQHVLIQRLCWVMTIFSP